MKDLKPGTLLVHSDRLHGHTNTGSLVSPIYQSVAYETPDIQTMRDIFQNKKPGYNYARQLTPTTHALESKITALENALGTIVFATGMGAWDAVFTTLLRHGDHVIASRYLFGNTVSLLKTYRDRFGIEVDFVDITDFDAVKAAARDNTRMLVAESVANPSTDVPALRQIGAFCLEKRIVNVLDNTVLSPLGLQAKTVKASLVIHSLTKVMGGHGQWMGGSVTDTGCFDWLSVPNLIEPKYVAEGEKSYLLQLRKKGLRDKGAALASVSASALAMGIETLALRTERSAKNALRIAEHLQSHSAIAKVNYPGLSNHPQAEEIANTFQQNGFLLSFVIKDVANIDAFFDSLQLIARSNSLGDNRTLCIHPATTIFAELTAEERLSMNIGDGLVRLSVGIEDAEDLISDLDQALAKMGA